MEQMNAIESVCFIGETRTGDLATFKRIIRCCGHKLTLLVTVVKTNFQNLLF